MMALSRFGALLQMREDLDEAYRQLNSVCDSYSRVSHEMQSAVDRMAVLQATDYSSLVNSVGAPDIAAEAVAKAVGLGCAKVSEETLRGFISSVEIPRFSETVRGITAAAAAYSDHGVDVETEHDASLPTSEAELAESNETMANTERSTPPTPARFEGHHPPASARYLLMCVLPPERQEDILGDFDELYYRRLLPEFGPRKANFAYWAQAGWSTLPMIWSMARELLKMVFRT